MTLTVEPTPVEAPDAGVIEDARARQRRYRGMAGGAITVAVAAVMLAFAWGGGSGGAGHSLPAPLRVAPISTAKCVLPRAPSSTSQGAPDRALLSILGVLRRPARPADAPGALPAPYRHVEFDQEVFVRYIRRARVVSGRAYYVIPAIFTRCEPERAYEGISFLGFGGGHGPTGVLVANAAFERLGVIESRGTTVEGLVPDGVSTVTLHYRAQPADGSGRAALPAVTITVRPVNNVVVFTHVPREAGLDQLYSAMIWRDANGHIIKDVPQTVGIR